MVPPLPTSVLLVTSQCARPWVRSGAARAGRPGDVGVRCAPSGNEARLGLPAVIVQEGGYLQPALGENLTSFLGGFGG